MEEDDREWERADDVKGVPFVVGVDGVVGTIKKIVNGRLQDGRKRAYHRHIRGFCFCLSLLRCQHDERVSTPQTDGGNPQR